MALSGPDDVDIDGAHTLLHRHGPQPRWLFLAEEVGLERDHPRVCHQQRRIDWDERSGWSRVMVALGEEVYERLADLLASHPASSSS